eukprot:Phypoly_transcript_05916.p1 GENE.Phypoly_transcript_05916~~Phypoly_transcript_05916.p1  ORF type:complete len:392 (+),score=65.50 Phypoly_transcript_05916:668-1843(+)
MVGALLAACLGKKGVKTALVEGSMPASLSSMVPIRTPDLRVSSLNRKSTQLLEAVGAWPLIQSAAATPFTRMEVWDTHGGLISFEDGGAPLGHIVENRVTVSALYDIIHEHKVKAIHGEVTGIKKEDQWPYVILKDGTKLQARLIVGADGGRSVARSYISPSVVGWSYAQNAVVATVSHPEGVHNDTAWQQFLSSGPIALLPLHDNYSSIVWSTSPRHTEYLLGLDTDAFLRELRAALAPPASSHLHMPPIEGIVGKRGAFPLKFEHALQYTGDRVALVGDAAHTVHPMAGQGVNLGMADVHALVSSISTALSTGQDIGSPLVLEEYEKKRKSENHVISLGIDVIKQLYSAPAPLGKLVSWGVSALNHFPPSKHLLKQMAMGKAVTEPLAL